MLKSKLFFAGLMAAALSLVAAERSEAQFGFVGGGHRRVWSYVGRPWYGGYFGRNYGYYNVYDYCTYNPYYYNFDPGWYGNPGISYYQPWTTIANPTLSVPPANSAVTKSTATVEVIVPANAELWVDGTKTTQTGTNRLFVTPSLAAGSTNTYEIRATWTDPEGAPVNQTRVIQVQPKQQSIVNLMP